MSSTLKMIMSIVKHFENTITLSSLSSWPDAFQTFLHVIALYKTLHVAQESVSGRICRSFLRSTVESARESAMLLLLNVKSEQFC